MPIIFMFFAAEFLSYYVLLQWISFADLFVILLLQTFFGFYLIMNARSIYYKSVGVFHIVPFLILRMVGTLMLIPVPRFIKYYIFQKFLVSLTKNPKIKVFFSSAGMAPDSENFSFDQNNYGQEMFNQGAMKNVSGLERDVTPKSPQQLDQKRDNNKGNS